jgi:hypothetical protein
MDQRPRHRPEIEQVRSEVDSLTSREALDRWIDAAIEAGVDPL